MDEGSSDPFRSRYIEGVSVIGDNVRALWLELRASHGAATPRAQALADQIRAGLGVDLALTPEEPTVPIPLCLIIEADRDGVLRMYGILTAIEKGILLP